VARAQANSCEQTGRNERNGTHAHDLGAGEDPCGSSHADGEYPGEEPRFEAPVLPQDVRRKLGTTQSAFAAMLHIPVATLRNWEQNRFVMEPAAQTVLKLIDREPEASLRALRGTQDA
jgi:hypothetical protein